jgi:hypothetical protein
VQAEEVVGSYSDEDEAVDEAENSADDNDLVVKEELEDADPQLEIRYRACFGDTEKIAVPQAFNSSNSRYRSCTGYRCGGGLMRLSPSCCLVRSLLSAFAL